MKKLNLLLTIGAALTLAACSSTNAGTSNADKMLAQKVESDLTTSINSIHQALTELQTISRGARGVTDTKTAIGNSVAGRVVAKAGTPAAEVKTATTPTGKVVAQPASATETKLAVDAKKIDPKSSVGKEVVLSSLDQRMNLKWNGDANDLLGSLSRKIGFAYSVEGTKTATPVSIAAKNKSVKEVFGLIDAQTNSKADIKISSTDKTVKFIYK